MFIIDCSNLLSRQIAKEQYLPSSIYISKINIMERGANGAILAMSYWFELQNNVVLALLAYYLLTYRGNSIVITSFV